MSPLPPPSKLDSTQVLQHVYDESLAALRVNTGATINVEGVLEVAIDATTDSIKIHGNDPAGVDRTIKTSEDGSIDIDGVYNGSINTEPANIGLVAHTRVISPGDNDQNKRLTAITNATVHALDVSLHDENGNAYSSTNPLQVRARSGNITTYATAINNFTYAANGTDIFTITGSNTKVVKIKHISFDGIQNATSARSVLLLRRSSQNIGGTATVLPNVPFDTLNPPATAVVRYYTANPTTLGTLVGVLHSEKLILGAQNTADSDSLVFSTIDALVSQDITLRGSSEILCINMNGVTSTGNLVNIDIMWTEE